MFIATNVTAVLILLRGIITEHDLSGYIVPSGDAHYTEFIAKCDERRAHISGFTGSAGTAIVTNSSACLWTDGRYFLQAEQQLSSDWTLMKDGQSGTPSQSKWLKENLPKGSKVGVDPTLYTKRQWDAMQADLQSVDIELVGVLENLVDKIWENRPACGTKPVDNHSIDFAGVNASTKLTNVRKEMSENEATVLVVTELDEIAWLLNLRGGDIPYSSTFASYVIVTSTGVSFFVNETKLTSSANSSLKANIPEITVHPYDLEILWSELHAIVTSATGKIWYTPNTNYALVQVIESNVNETMRVIKLTPISLMKAVKNPTEFAGYREALIRDSAAICAFLSWLEIEMAKGTLITEISAAEKLQSIRKEQANYVDESFPTISAAGVNGAIIHYMPTPETNRKINSTNVYLLDSGGLYRDGTTDITRTIHLGQPSTHQKNCYTRVLKGQMALARAVFPYYSVGSRLDSFARQYLWEAGLDYNHGTGHGIGSFLNVHEGPFGIGGGYMASDPGLRENFFTSNEPGYYEDNAFGIRLENIIRVKNASLANNFLDQGFLEFEDLTFVPYHHKLIDFSLLDEDELEYLNSYQEKVRVHVGDYMKEHNMGDDAINWLIKNTLPINENGTIPISPTEEPPATTSQKSAADSVRQIALIHLKIALVTVAILRIF